MISTNLDDYEVLSILGGTLKSTCYKVKCKKTSRIFVWKALDIDKSTNKQRFDFNTNKEDIENDNNNGNFIKIYSTIQAKEEEKQENTSTMYVITEYCENSLLNLIKKCKFKEEGKEGCYIDESFLWYFINSTLRVLINKSSPIPEIQLKLSKIFVDEDFNIKFYPKKLSTKVLSNKKNPIYNLGIILAQLCALKTNFDEKNFKSEYYSEQILDLIQRFLENKEHSVDLIKKISCHPTISQSISYKKTSLFVKCNKKSSAECVSSKNEEEETNFIHLNTRNKCGKSSSTSLSKNEEGETHLINLNTRNKCVKSSSTSLSKNEEGETNDCNLIHLNSRNKCVKSSSTSLSSLHSKSSSISSNSASVLTKISSSSGEKNQENIEQNKNGVDLLKDKIVALRNLEDKLREKERELKYREKKVALQERMVKEKITRADVYLKRCKETNSNNNKIKIKSKNLGLEKKEKDFDTSFSADCGDSSILPTSKKLNTNLLLLNKPPAFSLTTTKITSEGGTRRGRVQFKGHSPLRTIHYTNNVCFNRYNNNSNKNSKKLESEKTVCVKDLGENHIYANDFVDLHENKENCIEEADTSACLTNNKLEKETSKQGLLGGLFRATMRHKKSSSSLPMNKCKSKRHLTFKLNSGNDGSTSTINSETNSGASSSNNDNCLKNVDVDEEEEDIKANSCQPIAWPEETKRHAFELLRMLNSAENNLCNDMKHTYL